MLYVCEKRCQVRVSGRVVTVRKGDVQELEEEHPCFRKIGEDLDFATAGEAELLEADFELKELKDFIREKYGKNPRTRNRENTIRMLLDCRYRDLDGREKGTTVDGLL